MHGKPGAWVIDRPGPWPFKAFALTVVVAMCVTACGSSSKQMRTTRASHKATGSSTATASPATAASPGISRGQTARRRPSSPPLDRDNDYEWTSNPRSYYDSDDYDRPYYPDKANAADTRSVAVLVKRYLAAAADEDGATACSLMYSLFAEMVPETWGQSATRSPYEHGKTCAQVMRKLFAERHSQLAVEATSVQVTDLQTNERRGLALLRFAHLPSHKIDVHREHGAWRIDALFDIETT